MNITATTTYTSEGSENANSYEWALEPKTSATIVSDYLSSTVYWNHEFRGTANIQLTSLNVCGENISEAFNVEIFSTVGFTEKDINDIYTIFPNPNDGTFTIILTPKKFESRNLSIKISILLGEIVYEKKKPFDPKNIELPISLSNVHNGIYLLIIDGSDNYFVKKFVIQ